MQISDTKTVVRYSTYNKMWQVIWPVTGGHTWKWYSTFDRAFRWAFIRTRGV